MAMSFEMSSALKLCIGFLVGVDTSWVSELPSFAVEHDISDSGHRSVSSNSVFTPES